MIYVIAINSGGFSPRQMKLATGTELMNYNLYRDVSRTQIWGDGSGSTSRNIGVVLKKIPVNYSVYGRIPAGQDIVAGLYIDILTVTIEW